MEGRAFYAILLVSLLVVSGCLGNADIESEIPEDENQFIGIISLNASWGALIQSIPMDGTPIVLQVVIASEGDDWEAQPTILTPNFTSLSLYEWEKNQQGYQLSFVPEITGDYSIQIEFATMNNAEFSDPKPERLTQVISVQHYSLWQIQFELNNLPTFREQMRVDILVDFSPTHTTKER